MIISQSSSKTSFIHGTDCHATLSRLVGNLSGFAYRRRYDARWTMEFISAGFRDITGYDPHRFINNASLAFGDLIARPDWEHVNERVRLAVLHRRRINVEYLIRVAHGALVRVEDRLTPIFYASGQVRAIEGVIDLARGSPPPLPTPPPASAAMRPAPPVRPPSPTAHHEHA